MLDTEEVMINNGAGCSETSRTPIAAHYAVVLPLYKEIKKMGMTVTRFHCDNYYFAFTYITGPRKPFDYAELMQLQQIINPCETKKYPIPMGYFGEYTLYVPISSFTQ